MKSLYFRVFVLIVYTVALSTLLGFYVSNVYYHWKLKPLTDAKLTGIAEEIRAFAERNPAMLGEYLSHTAALGYQIYLVDRNRNEMFFGHPFRKGKLSDDIKRIVLEGEVYHGVAEYPDYPFLTGYFENSLSNSVGVRLQDGEEAYALFLRPDIQLQFGELRIYFFLIFLLTVLFSIPTFLLSTRYLVQPVTLLTEATKKIAQGHYNLQLNTNRKDEIGQLASHFQTMSRELERADKAKREFVANVSHEIHSPLSSIQGFADMLQTPELPDELRRSYAGIIGQEARRLAALSRQLLLLSTLDNAGEAGFAKQEHNLKRQIHHALRLMEWQLTEKMISVRMAVPGHLVIRGDGVLLLQVWTNLLSNAVKHVPEGRSISIQARCEGGNCVVEVADTGDGIPEDQLPFIYDRFFRGDKARSRTSGSTGLGLSIVQKIVHRHGGTIEAFSQSGVGTTFRVSIPM
ncbi:sensor histidine kinase [Cohnella thermotolerans]|uniref:sensor histidine kinase n=1 Tax=Cohnella thermotolerans TaxID=329858 RepID=UPI000401504F|nr:HAMP domain-containing sensor histidine kinase [Cohnella thermotolerans]